MKNTLYIFFLLCSTLLSAQSVKFISIDELETYQDLLAIARQKDQMIFIALYQEGDVFQDMYRGDVFEKPEVKSYWNKIIPVATDIRSEMGAAFANQFLIDSLPLFMVLNMHEFVVARKSGSMNASAMANFLNQASTNKNLYDSLSAKYVKHTLTNSEWQNLIQLHSFNFPFEETMSLALEYMATLDDNSLSDAGNLKILTTYGIDMETPYPNKVFKNLSAIISKNKKFKTLDFYEIVYSYNMDLAINSKDTLLLEKILTELIPKHPDSTVNKNELKLSSARLFAEETNIFQPYTNTILSEAEKVEGDSAKAEYLFDEAYFIADTYNEEAPLKAGLQIIEKSISIRETYKYRMLESYLYYLLKNKTNATSSVAKAKELSSDAVDIKRAESLEKLIARLK